MVAWRPKLARIMTRNLSTKHKAEEATEHMAEYITDVHRYVCMYVHTYILESKVIHHENNSPINSNSNSLLKLKLKLKLP